MTTDVMKDGTVAAGAAVYSVFGVGLDHWLSWAIGAATFVMICLRAYSAYLDGRIKRQTLASVERDTDNRA